MEDKSLDIGNLVWAKLKGYPYWPAKIASPPNEKKYTPKKPQHYVYFFGSDNFAWVMDEHIVPHTEEMLQSCNKKRSIFLKKAVDDLMDELNNVTSSSSEMKPKRRSSLVRENDGAAVTSSISELQFNSLFSKCRSADRQIGFLGLGMVGRKFVKKLLGKYNVTVWNRTMSKCVEFVKAGASLANTPADVAEKCDIIFCCVSDSKAVREIVLGENGIVMGIERCISREKGYVEMTTIDPVTSEKLSEAIVQKGARYLEAPLSGSKQVERKESLIVVCSGDVELYTHCKSIFSSLSLKTQFTRHNIGYACKLNILVSSFMSATRAALQEQMELIEKNKLSPATFVELLEKGPLSCPEFIRQARDMIFKKGLTDNTLKYQQKDLSLALELSDSCDQAMFVTCVANQQIKRAINERNPESYEWQNGADKDGKQVSAVYLEKKIDVI